ncbi:MAG TPA: hypothetical protein PKD45_14505 [Flavobacteriales bacterium]|nr:hypothetical protein [Flavobacteriales bacterium]
MMDDIKERMADVFATLMAVLFLIALVKAFAGMALNIITAP